MSELDSFSHKKSYCNKLITLVIVGHSGSFDPICSLLFDYAHFTYNSLLIFLFAGKALIVVRIRSQPAFNCEDTLSK